MAPEHCVGIFWDIENCSLPTASSVAAVVQNIRREGQTYGAIRLFQAYGDVNRMNPAKRVKIHASGVTMSDTPHGGGKNVADMTIINDVWNWVFDYEPEEATVVIISGDRDYSPTISKLRHRAFRVVVICPVHGNAHPSLVANASEAIDWDIIIRNTSEPDRQLRRSTSYVAFPPLGAFKTTPFLFNRTPATVHATPTPPPLPPSPPPEISAPSPKSPSASLSTIMSCQPAPSLTSPDHPEGLPLKPSSPLSAAIPIPQRKLSAPLPTKPLFTATTRQTEPCSPTLLETALSTPHMQHSPSPSSSPISSPVSDPNAAPPPTSTDASSEVETSMPSDINMNNSPGQDTLRVPQESITSITTFKLPSTTYARTTSLSLSKKRKPAEPDPDDYDYMGPYSRLEKTAAKREADDNKSRAASGKKMGGVVWKR
ncbi:hypothetical protein CYLTODRAFT_76659 [Cylindrobasidium torrendii FP15055 ss-10]|uniref:NYN domain-containing protein n=1 Tax=Cylindrobasidium torrendii FP15055 ss-10 TaxID=1314674 RepID=A0A0D7B370_9AGAR|nr:hypothetical protein CYLTODRAFT_76659 [Cylindrobasidium torrendii FP15055 ss-10]